MLPPPKRDHLPTPNSTGVKKPARKVFSLKTSAEPAFSRDLDLDYDESLYENTPERNAAQSVPLQSVSVPASDLPVVGNAMRFKPLSVARNNKKSKPTTVSKAATTVPNPQKQVPSPLEASAMQTSKPKVNLFSTTVEEPIDGTDLIEQADRASVDDVEDATEDSMLTTSYQDVIPSDTGQTDQSLHDIASDLNLSASAKRQLFGRGGKDGIAVNVVNFNTDAEYAANEQLRATGEQLQHNPVRGIAPGKHSLKQLMNSATLQKDALEESFATGRRNKREAGNKYGW